MSGNRAANPRGRRGTRPKAPRAAPPHLPAALRLRQLGLCMAQIAPRRKEAARIGQPAREQAEMRELTITGSSSLIGLIGMSLTRKNSTWWLRADRLGDPQRVDLGRTGQRGQAVSRKHVADGCSILRQESQPVNHRGGLTIRLVHHFNILTDYRLPLIPNALADRLEKCFACVETEGKP